MPLVDKTNLQEGSAGNAFSMGVLGGALAGEAAGSGGSGGASQYLLRQLSDEESGDEAKKAEAVLAKARKSCFVQELVLSTLAGPPTGQAASGNGSRNNAESRYDHCSTSSSCIFAISRSIIEMVYFLRKSIGVDFL